MPIETNSQDFMLGRIDGTVNSIHQLLTAQSARIDKLETSASSASAHRAAIDSRVTILEASRGTSKNLLTMLVAFGGFAMAAINTLKGFF